MRVVVTGASGNLGTSLLGALGNDPDVDTIIGVSRRTPTVQLPKVEWQSADIATAPLGPILQGADAVVHLAWLIQPSHRPTLMERTNVTGSRRVFRAAVDAGVKTVVHLSSVGAYGPGPKSQGVDEDWPIESVRSSFYSRHKVAVERMIDDFERDNPETRFVRMRPGLMLKRESAGEIRRLFFGHLPLHRLGRKPIPFIPKTPGFVVQAVHPSDVAEAIRESLHRDVRGAFNLVAEPAMDGATLARVAGVPAIPMPAAALRAAASAAWHLRIQPTAPGWVDLLLAVPLLNSERARKELEWEPKVSAEAAWKELLGGIADDVRFPTPPLSNTEL